MKQMRNLLTGIFLMLGMLLTTLPVVAQGIEAELDSVANGMMSPLPNRKKTRWM